MKVLSLHTSTLLCGGFLGSAKMQIKLFSSSLTVCLPGKRVSHWESTRYGESVCLSVPRQDLLDGWRCRTLTATARAVTTWPPHQGHSSRSERLHERCSECSTLFDRKRNF